MGKVFIKKLCIKTCHGVNDFEKKQPKRFVFSAEIDCDFYEAAKNDEISQTVTSPGRIFGTAAEYGAPILPTTHVVRPAFRKISPVSVVVVVLPFVPVTASRSPVDSR